MRTLDMELGKNLGGELTRLLAPGGEMGRVIASKVRGGTPLWVSVSVSVIGIIKGSREREKMM